MRKLALTFLAIFGNGAAKDTPPPVKIATDLNGDTRLTAIISAFSKSYDQDFGGASRNAMGEIVLRFRDHEFVYDDGRKKTFEELLETPDIEDSFSQTYPLKNPTDKLPADFDPGRIRVEELFKTLYGTSEEEVTQNCESMDFCGHIVKFNSRCGAAMALKAVGKDLMAIFAKNPELKEYVAELGGTFQWRFIAGTQRLSNHSFGNAIDLNVKKSAYWRWDSPSRLESFSRKEWPVEIIEAFERHGFIWGGKWWHYDTMHFEYRPELIAFARGRPAETQVGHGDALEKTFASSPYAAFTRTSKVEILTLVQARLRYEGIYTGKVDGTPESQTTAAIRGWQKQWSLEETGTLDSQTLQLLGLEGLPEFKTPPKTMAPSVASPKTSQPTPKIRPKQGLPGTTPPQ